MDDEGRPVKLWARLLFQPRQMTVFAEPSTFWDTFARYDSGWYEGIARNGYAYAAGGRSNIAYFPVYPMLMRYVGRQFGRYHAAFYFGGIVDNILMRLVDAAFTFPAILFALLLAVTMGQGLGTLVLAITILAVTISALLTLPRNRNSTTMTSTMPSSRAL